MTWGLEQVAPVHRLAATSLWINSVLLCVHRLASLAALALRARLVLRARTPISDLITIILIPGEGGATGGRTGGGRGGKGGGETRGNAT